MLDTGADFEDVLLEELVRVSEILPDIVGELVKLLLGDFSELGDADGVRVVVCERDKELV